MGAARNLDTYLGHLRWIAPNANIMCAVLTEVQLSFGIAQVNFLFMRILGLEYKKGNSNQNCISLSRGDVFAPTVLGRAKARTYNVALVAKETNVTPHVEI